MDGYEHNWDFPGSRFAASGYEGIGETAVTGRNTIKDIVGNFAVSGDKTAIRTTFRGIRDVRSNILVCINSRENAGAHGSTFDDDAYSNGHPGEHSATCKGLIPPNALGTMSD